MKGILIKRDIIKGALEKREIIKGNIIKQNNRLRIVTLYQIAGAKKK